LSVAENLLSLRLMPTFCKVWPWDLFIVMA
jgi:hypothetical protein